MTLFLRHDIANAWPSDQVFQKAASQQGDIYRNKEGRRTLRFVHNDKSYFLKYHAGIGWKEIIKNLSQGKLPVTSALNEVRAIKAMQQAEIDTMTIAAYGERGKNPARIESFIVTDDLTDTLSIEEAALHWQGHVPRANKWALLQRLGDIARRMHQAGINHRDFYICHFLIKQQDFNAGNFAAPIYLIDLHRSQVHNKLSRRWKVKDLGGLYFSAAPLALSRTDLFRFVRAYTGQSPAKAIRRQSQLWQAVRQEAERLYRRAYDTTPSLPLPYQLPVIEEGDIHHE